MTANTKGYKINDRVIIYGKVKCRIVQFREPKSILVWTPADAQVQHGRRKEWISCGSDQLEIDEDYYSKSKPKIIRNTGGLK